MIFRFIKDIISIILIQFYNIFGKKGIVILEYHRVSANISPDDVHSIYPNEFRFQIKLLNKLGYEFLNLPNAIKLLKNGFDKKKKYVVLTFDDGHKDNYKYAYPILKEYNAFATFFIISDYVGKSGWMDYFGNLHTKNTNNFQRWELLSWKELSLMKDHFFVEVHGKSHKALDSLSLKDLNDELIISKNKINSKLNLNTSVFCYPWGKFNKQAIKATIDCGYVGACSTNPGLNFPFETDLWKLKRNEVGRGISKVQFKLLLTNGIIFYDNISFFFNRIKLYIKKLSI
jgi:peptidoglycan/xylan/chitin deacetylase (PgdA/CDA1 family)